MIRYRAIVPLLLAVCSNAQTQVVDYPDGSLGQPAEYLFPLHTLGGGSVVRYQTVCPSAFVGLPQQPMIVTGFGMQLAGQAVYSTFEVRLGTSMVPQLTPYWVTNLPDQTLQVDLSGTTLVGGGTNSNPVNQWVQYDLRKPFLWQPGEAIVLDVISGAMTTGVGCFTARGDQERLFDVPYLGGPTGGVLLPDGGIKFRVVFEPLGVLPFGGGCAGSGGFVPALSGVGSFGLGATSQLELGNALGGSFASLQLGFSRHEVAGLPLPIALGGGCSLLTSGEVNVFAPIAGAGAGNGTVSLPVLVPNDVGLRGMTLFAQWLVLDSGSPAYVTAVMSNGGVVVVH